MSSAEFNLTINGEPYEANRKNTTLFTYLGELGIYDHVFMVMSETEQDYTGCYVFKVAQEPLYKKIAKMVAQHNFPQVLNRQAVPDCDVNAWNNKMYGDLTETIPDSWNDTDHDQQQ